MACHLGTPACFVPPGSASLSFVSVEAQPRSLWRYSRAVCTGLGDRMAVIMTLGALAHLSDADVEFKWCEDPSEVYDIQRPFMPQWSGFSLPYDIFMRDFTLPRGVKVVRAYNFSAVREVTYVGNELPAHEGLDAVYTHAFRTTHLAEPVRESLDFQRAYATAGAQLGYKRILRDVFLGGGWVIHIRAPDHNTFAYDWSPHLYCLDKIVSFMLKRSSWPHVTVMSNDPEWARARLNVSSANLTYTYLSAYEDMGLLLQTWGGIVQYAPPGYSSFSCVPAMAKGIPLLSVYKGADHRYKLYDQHGGGIPDEFYTCGTWKAFARRVEARIQLRATRERTHDS